MVATAVKYKPQIIAGFKLFYLLLLLGLGIGGIVMQKPAQFGTVYNLGVNAGQAAIVTFCITLLPGITRRLGFREPIFAVLMLFRRYLGISVFILSFTHVMIVSWIARLDGTIPLFNPLLLFEWFGFIAFICLLCMFLTSNDVSVARLGIWWKRIHSLVYIIAWLLFAHIGLQGFGSIWSLLISITAIVELWSLVYFYLIKPKPASSPPPQQV